MLAIAGLFVAVIASTQPSTLPTGKWLERDGGQLMLRTFQNAPFPHSSRKDGFTSKDEHFPAEQHYSDSTVGVFIPDGFVSGDTVDFVVHFHGHRNNVANVLHQFDLRRQFVESRLNAILIVPQGPQDAPDSGCGKLEHDPGKMRALLQEVLEFLHAEGKVKRAKLGRVALSAHSGGYKVTGAVLQIGGIGDHITDVLLFDATYGQLEAFADFGAASRDTRLVSIFTQHLADENFDLITLLQKRNANFVAIMESELTDAVLSVRGKPILIHTTELAHNDVLSAKRDYFRRFVETSALNKIK